MPVRLVTFSPVIGPFASTHLHNHHTHNVHHHNVIEKCGSWLGLFCEIYSPPVEGGRGGSDSTVGKVEVSNNSHQEMPEWGWTPYYQPKLKGKQEKVERDNKCMKPNNRSRMCKSSDPLSPEGMEEGWDHHWPGDFNNDLTVGRECMFLHGFLEAPGRLHITEGRERKSEGGGGKNDPHHLGIGKINQKAAKDLTALFRLVLWCND